MYPDCDFRFCPFKDDLELSPFDRISKILVQSEVLPIVRTDWVIVGGESGPRSRPIKQERITEIRDQCLQSNDPFFSSNGVAFEKKKMVDTLKV